MEELGFQEKKPLSIGEAGEGKRAYEELERLYSRAEEWMPTRFRGYEEKSKEHYFFVKNNYYYSNFPHEFWV